jgi:hypothetical protein
VVLKPASRVASPLVGDVAGAAGKNSAVSSSISMHEEEEKQQAAA